jgi:hypothetical protein
MTKDEAVLAAAALLTGRVEADLIDDLAAEAVQLILDYCHIPDFPEALIPVAADGAVALSHRDERPAAGVSQLSVGDTSITYGKADTGDVLSAFASRLHPYRRVAW